MKVDVNVRVHPLTRVEGHGDLAVRVVDGKLVEARWDVVETPRYFEVMLKGKHYTSAAILTARICGICSIGHALASVRATERAFGVEIPETAAKLRLLCKHGETLQSHVLHLLFLAAPDFLGLPSVLPLMESSPQTVALAARVKGTANRLCEVVAGRATHPVSIQVGGMAAFPDRRALTSLRGELEAAAKDLAAVVELFRGFEIPAFSRQTEFVSLLGEDGYPWIGGALLSTDGVLLREDDYLRMTNEFVDERNTSKLCRLSRESFAVGALARWNNNHRFLHPAALHAARELGLGPDCHNPFMNNVAQLVECVHVVHESAALIEELLAAPESAPLLAPVTPIEGEGVGAVEVPRGILYHHYRYGADGRVVRANCIIPTTQNNLNIQHDLEALARHLAAEGADDRRIETLCSMLVRAYDPCISCSVH
ncbi:MAG: Ni/Fe hydrogenase subunit alpha [Acidobacteriota bacterium]